jgi:outer membrane protein
LSDAERVKRQRELSEMDKDYQRRQREFREDLNQRRNEELAAVLEKANKVIRQLAEAEKYDIVFQEAVYYSPRIDITDKVLKSLNAK